MEKKILDIIKESIENDFFTPIVKAEVIFDMLLTPVITEIVKVITRENMMEIDAELIAKEFPLLNKNFEEYGKDDFTNCNVDYLLRSKDKKVWYLVELKTTGSSEGRKQKRKYETIVEETIPIYRQFVELLVHVYGEEYGNWKTDSLKSIFEKIVGKQDLDKETNYKELAYQKLKADSLAGSKKYLYTAAEVLTRGIGLETVEDKELYDFFEIIYITPNKNQEKKKDKNNGNNEVKINYISFGDILDTGCKDKIRNEIKDEVKKEYWDWLVKILESCYL